MGGTVGRSCQRRLCVSSHAGTTLSRMLRVVHGVLRQVQRWSSHNILRPRGHEPAPKFAFAAAACSAGAPPRTARTAPTTPTSARPATPQTFPSI